MHFSYILVLPLLFVFFSCAHVIKNPPDQQEIAKIKQSVQRIDASNSDSFIMPLQTNTRWATQYLAAKSFLDKNQLDQACHYFSLLHKEKKFPLKNMIPYYILSTCKFDRDQLIDFLDKYNDDTPEWLTSKYFSQALILVQKFDLDQHIAKYYFKLAKLKRTSKEKEQYILEALKHDNLDEYRNELYKIAPRFKDNISIEESISIASDFSSNRDMKDARYYYSKVIDSDLFDINDKILAHDKSRKTYKLERDKESFLTATINFCSYLENLKDKDLKQIDEKKLQGNINDKIFDCHLEIARTSWTLEKNKEALKQLQRMMHLFIDVKKYLSNDKDTNEERIAQIYVTQSQIHFENKKNKIGLKELLSANEKIETVKNLTLIEKIKWSLGLYYYQNHKLNNALKYWEEYLANNSNSLNRDKFEYWTARAYAKLNNKSKSNEIFNNLMQKGPFTFYGIMAQKELQIPFSPIKGSMPSLNLTDLPYEIQWPLMLNDQEILHEYVKNSKQQIVSENLFQTLAIYFLSNVHEKSLQAFFTCSEQEKATILKSFPNYVFPNPYQIVLRQLGQDKSVDPALALSIIRQESAFNQYARSFADAFGPMQIIPEKAKVLAEELQIEYGGYSDLYKPEINIKLGSYLLSKILKEFKNNLIITVASYNAGEDAVKRWEKKWATDDYMEFIEKIPYNETKQYVKLILRNYIIYKQLSTDKPFMFPNVW